MTNWTPEARECMEGYLRQVTALARHQGDDAEEITDGLRAHITREAEDAGASLVTLDHVRHITAALGTPEEITESGLPSTPNMLSASAPPPPPRPAEEKKSRLGCWIFASVALVIGVMAAPFILAIGGTVLYIAVPAGQRARETALRETCANRLEAYYSVLSPIAEQSDDGHFPPVDPESGVFMFDSGEFPEMFTCPGYGPGRKDLPRVTDASFIYLGYFIRNQEQAEAFLRVYTEARKGTKRLGNSIDLGGGLGTVSDLAPIDESSKEGREIGWTIPLLIERPSNHEPSGGNVLYLDGHVEFLRLNEKFPMTDAFFEAVDRAKQDGPIQQHP